jgi:hypothetical protein
MDAAAIYSFIAGWRCGVVASILVDGTEGTCQ